jgi:HSP20 family molecular chaperone IbpA
MAFFSGIPSSDFGPLFRLLDDYDNHRSSNSPATSGGPRHSSAIRSFAPKFDVREQKDAYELLGELPGIDQKDISIEFSDSNTLVVKGRVERSDSYGTGKPSGRITHEEHDHNKEYHKPTAEDEDAAKKQDESSKQVSKQGEGKQEPKYKYWVAERSVGEFHRSFTFPNRVDTDNVKASLKNGILTITVKKAAEPQAKKINIE